jgi:hypothetical protein
MATSNSCFISLRIDHDDPIFLGKRVISLRKNLESSGVRVTAHRGEEVLQPDSGFEAKSDPATLYTLAITFLTSGAAVAVVNALRATFEAAHSANLKATVTIGSQSLELSGEHLSGQEAQKLEETLDEWIRVKQKGAAAS